jgi:hypothetical protein
MMLTLAGFRIQDENAFLVLLRTYPQWIGTGLGNLDSRTHKSSGCTLKARRQWLT